MWQFDHTHTDPDFILLNHLRENQEPSGSEHPQASRSTTIKLYKFGNGLALDLQDYGPPGATAGATPQIPAEALLFIAGDLLRQGKRPLVIVADDQTLPVPALLHNVNPSFSQCHTLPLEYEVKSVEPLPALHKLIEGQHLHLDWSIHPTANKKHQSFRIRTSLLHKEGHCSLYSFEHLEWDESKNEYVTVHGIAIDRDSQRQVNEYLRAQKICMGAILLELHHKYEGYFCVKPGAPDILKQAAQYIRHPFQAATRSAPLTMPKKYLRELRVSSKPHVQQGIET